MCISAAIISISPNSDDANIKFSDYLRRYAPYTTIRQLENWLEEKKFIVLDKYNLTSGDDSYSDILHAMEVAFADVAVHRRRVGALIAHDAVQLAALNRDYNLGRRSIFITADRQVREFVSNSQSLAPRKLHDEPCRPSTTCGSLDWN